MAQIRLDRVEVALHSLNDRGEERGSVATSVVCPPKTAHQ